MSNQKFRQPKEMQSRKERVPLSARVLSNTAEVLKKHSKKTGLSVSEIASNVLDDYGAWLTQEEKHK